ncbi:MAG: alpha-glucoside-specific PTS transporter subunit IIBC [Brevinema sp.]
MNKIKEMLARFGAAMFVPVLLFSFSGLLVGITIVLKTPEIVGSLADPDTIFYKILVILEEGGWSIFRNMPLFFCLGIPIGLAKMAPERAVLATLICYLSFNYFIASILGFWGESFGVDFSQDPGGVSGLVLIAGIKTLDTNILGGIIVGGIITTIHNRFYEFRLPDYLGVFQGTSFVHIIGFFAMLPLAFLTAWVWPPIQSNINNLQLFLASAGPLGVWIYTFLERILIPTGLHHFIYGPFIFGPAVVPNGIEPTWFQNVSQFASNGAPLKELFPAGAFALHGNGKVFGSIGIALAMYSTADPQNKKRVAALLIPATLTAAIVGITEPLEFTFLFIAPMLFLIHSMLAATLATTLYIFGVVGNMGAGLLQFLTANWIFTFRNHSSLIFIQIMIGILFTGIYFLVFRYLIIKNNIPTPGRGDTSKMKLYSKKEYQSAKNNTFEEQAKLFLEALGGSKNIESVTNCATRLRVVVKDPNLIADIEVFRDAKAHGLVVDNCSIQVIVGLSVPQVKTAFDQLRVES